MPKGVYPHKPLSEETKRKIGQAHFGEKSQGWKGNNASAIAIHMWLARNKPRSPVCENCGKTFKTLELANIKNHIYTRKFEDYRWMCHKCHMAFDSKNLKMCWRGLHKFEGDNIGKDKRGFRFCKTCKIEYNKLYKIYGKKGERIRKNG